MSTGFKLAMSVVISAFAAGAAVVHHVLPDGDPVLMACMFALSGWFALEAVDHLAVLLAERDNRPPAWVKVDPPAAKYGKEPPFMGCDHGVLMEQECPQCEQDDIMNWHQ